MICQTRDGIPQVPNHFSEMGILDHKQRHCHGNGIVILRRTLFSLGRHLYIRLRLRLFFACLVFEERIHVFGAGIIGFICGNPLQFLAPAVYGAMGQFQFFAGLRDACLFHQFYGIALELFRILAHANPFMFSHHRTVRPNSIPVLCRRHVSNLFAITWRQ